MRFIRAILAMEGRSAGSMEIGETVLVKPDSKALMSLVIEKTAESELSVDHFYSQARDRMSDPEVLLKLRIGTGSRLDSLRASTSSGTILPDWISWLPGNLGSRSSAARLRQQQSLLGKNHFNPRNTTFTTAVYPQEVSI